MRRFLLCLSASLLALSVAGAQAAPRYVKGEGRAPIRGKDMDAARKAALANALYDAAGQLQTKVRGVNIVDKGVVVRDESIAVVSGTFQAHRVLFEGPEGGNYVVHIEAIGRDEGDSCEGKRVDLDMRAVTYKVAPAIQGHVQRDVANGVTRGIALLNDSGHFRVSDQRHLRPISGGERNNRSQYDYMAQITDSRPAPAGYSLSGEIIVERARRDYVVAEFTDITVTLTLKVKDNFTGAQIGQIRKSSKEVDSRAPFGFGQSFRSQPHFDMTPIFEGVRAELEETLACRPLRALVQDSSEGRVLLSVGLEHGIQEGDYFLVSLSNSRNDWQVLRIEDASPNQSVARPMKASPTIPVNTIAKLMR
jgi:hypothetical protein